jgi:hypothetical protein
MGIRSSSDRAHDGGSSITQVMTESLIGKHASAGREMRKQVLTILVILSALALQACSVTYYQLRSLIPAGPSSKGTAPCPSKYSLAIERYGKLMTVKERATPDSAEQFDKYVQATEDVFTRKGCDPEYIENPDGADFRIQVSISPALSALPQEYLTCFSLGIIPSWGVRQGEFQYTFENVTTTKNHIYFVDRPVYNHIFFLPVFWLSFVGLEEMAQYKEALGNFIENSKASPVRDKGDIRTKGASLWTGPRMVSLRR